MFMQVRLRFNHNAENASAMHEEKKSVLNPYLRDIIET